ncbi:hypothetical protein KCU88_g1688, partial [Aureobasidium melanogenum]
MCGHSATPGLQPGTPSTGSGSSDRDGLRAYVPNTPICIAAFDLAASALALTIVHHSLRVYLFAKWLAEKEEMTEWLKLNNEMLFVACICHDLGASERYNGPQRFEVVGADAAADLLRAFQRSESEVHEVWTAIALHTSPGIAERTTPLARLVRMGVLIDFRPATRAAVEAVDYGITVEDALPRLEIEKVLGDAVVQQAIQNPDTKAPAASWPGILYRSYLDDPTWTGVNQAF